MLFFSIFGHKNITAMHRNTLEFTKEDYVTRTGDCIVGIKSDFDTEKIKEFIKENRTFKVIIKIKDISDEVFCEINPDFDDDHEIVIRKTGFLSKRTLGINCTKAAKDLDRKLIEKLKNPENKAIVEFK
ncbi:MAG: DUF371 domain-containing protein [Nanoarchaeota archaeon]|nr:DUF371 domain-containing protein [Nanoarchaeota archaeon]